jgi:hypothetical protein
MGALVHPSFVSQMLRHLPGPLLRVLDAWSAREARRRREQRQKKWQQRVAAPAGEPEQGIAYHLKPWRD